jgi:aspartyl-tRNA(Asn)/glutamyl-tRNA(Gln) amidotransferase subunit B
VFIGVNDGNLEEGSFRCDANVSLRPLGETTFGTRVELKNINSFRFVQRAIDAEIARQTAILDSGGRVVQETRSFDPDTGKTASLRSKEEAHDYRYFPDPDLPPLVIGAELVEQERTAMGELPAQVRERWTTQLGLSESAAQTLSQHPAYVRFFEGVRDRAEGVEPRKIANFIQTEVLRGVKLRGQHAQFSVTEAQLAELLQLAEQGTISGKQAKELFTLVENTDASPRGIVAERGMAVVSDTGAIESVLRELIAGNPKQVESIRAGKKQVMGFFVGQVMKATQGSADPKVVSELLERLLSES